MTTDLKDRIETFLDLDWGENPTFAASVACLALVVDSTCNARAFPLAIPTDARMLIGITLGAKLFMEHPEAMYRFFAEHSRLLPTDKDMHDYLDRVEQLAGKQT